MTTTTSRPQTSGLRATGRLAERVTTPLLPADYLDVIDPHRRGRNCAAASSASIPRPATRVTVETSRAAAGGPTCRGSICALGIEVDGVRQWRSY